MESFWLLCICCLCNSWDVFATEEIHELPLRVFSVESSRLAKAFKIIRSNHVPNTASPLLNHIPKHGICKFLKYLLGWHLLHLPGQPVLMSDHEIILTGIALVSISVRNRRQSQTVPASISTGRWQNVKISLYHLEIIISLKKKLTDCFNNVCDYKLLSETSDCILLLICSSQKNWLPHPSKY